MDVSIRICGIPAYARILDYRPGDEGRVHGPPELCRPPEDEEVDFEILDRRGYRAEWLVDKAEQEGIDMEQEVLTQLAELRKDVA